MRTVPRHVGGSLSRVRDARLSPSWGRDGADRMRGACVRSQGLLWVIYGSLVTDAGRVT